MFLVTHAETGNGEISVLPVDRKLPAAQWMQLGSTRTTMKGPTPFWNIKSHSKPFHQFSGGPVASLARPLAAHAGRSLGASPVAKGPTSTLSHPPSASNIPVIPSPPTGAGVGPVPVSVAPSASTQPRLPPGWKQFAAASGQPYYHNEVTNQTTWTLPQGEGHTDASQVVSNASNRSSPPVPGASSGVSSSNVWIEYQNEEGKSYYHNKVNRQTTWDRPEGPDVAVVQAKDFQPRSTTAGYPGAIKATQQAAQAPVQAAPAASTGSASEEEIWYKAVDPKGRTYYYTAQNKVAWQLKPGANLVE